MTTRPAKLEDQAAMARIADVAGLFPGDMLPEMFAPSLEGSGETWLVAETAGAVAGFAFARPEEVTDRVWNILALGVDPAQHGKGLGRTLLQAMEAALPARLILIETTQLPEQAAARGLYAKAGYEEEGRVRDYYSDGEDKVIFRKRLDAPEGEV